MPNILVVDDTESDRQLTGSLIRRQADWSVRFAHNGDEALDRIAQAAPDLVLTDIQMPGMDGLELVVAVGQQYPSVPVQAGAASYVPKRRLVSDLSNTIRSVLAAAHADRSHASILERMVQNTSHIVIETDLFLLQSLLRYLRGVVQATRGLAAVDHTRVAIALDEALTNAFYHGNLELSSEMRERDGRKFRQLADQRRREKPYCDRRINMITTITPKDTTFVVRDDGPGFDVDCLVNPTDPENLHRPSGRGVMLMRTFLDTVTFNDKGNEVTLTKNLPSGPPTTA